METHDRRATGIPEEVRGGPWGSFEDWLRGQEGREDTLGAVARFVREDVERGCWEEVTHHDHLGLRDAVIRTGISRHLALNHNVSGKAVIAFQDAHRKYAEAQGRALREWGPDPWLMIEDV